MKKSFCFAGITVESEYNYNYLDKQCAGYETNAAPDMRICVSEEDIENERLRCESDGYPAGYLESLAFYRKFATAALDYGVLLFHGSAITLDGVAYIYTAPSGVGKSTHARLCREVFGERTGYINDDKPLLRKTAEGWLVFGTPWDGKHRKSSNTHAPLGGICLLGRGEKNSICKISAEAAFPTLFMQAYRPENSEKLQGVVTLLRDLCRIPLWQMKCNISREAAEMSLGAMHNEVK